MTVFGAAEMLGGWGTGRFINKVGKRWSLLTLIIITLASTGLTALCLRTKTYGIWFVTAFFWGLWDSFSQTLCNTILSTEFDSDVEPFAVFKFVQSLIIFAFLMVESWLNDNFTAEEGNRDRAQMIYLIAFEALAILCVAVAFLHKFK